MFDSMAPTHASQTRPTCRPWLRHALICSALACLSAVVACSDDDSSGTTPPPVGQDAAAGATQDAAVPDAKEEAAAEAAVEAAAEAAVEEDATADALEEAAADAAEEADAALKCEPQSVAAWTPTWHPPTGMYQGKCGAGEVKAIMDACYSSAATAQKCKDATALYATCTSCLGSNDTDATWGPIIKFTDLNFSDRNDSGCYALLEGDVSATGCGAKIQGYWECVQESCKPGCKIGTATFTKDLAAFNGCTKKAGNDPNYCKAQFEDYTACFAADKKYAKCQWLFGETWDVLAGRISELFCGIEPADGGTELDAAQE